MYECIYIIYVWACIYIYIYIYIYVYIWVNFFYIHPLSGDVAGGEKMLRHLIANAGKPTPQI